MGNAKFFSCLPFLAMANCLPSCWPLLLRRWLQKSCKLIGENSRNLDTNTKTESEQQMEHFGNGWTPIAGLSIKWPKMAPINCGPCIKCDYFFFFFSFLDWTAGLRHLPNNKHSFYYAADRDLWQQQTAVNGQLKFMQPNRLNPLSTHQNFHPSQPERIQLGVTTAATLESILIMCARRPQIMTSGVAQKWHRQHGQSTSVSTF